MWAFLSFFPNVMPTASFYLNIHLGRTIDLATAYTVLIFFDRLRHPINAMPWIINSTLELMVSMKRLENYFDSDEIKIENFMGKAMGSEKSIEIKKSGFSWGVK